MNKRQTSSRMVTKCSAISVPITNFQKVDESHIIMNVFSKNRRYSALNTQQSDCQMVWKRIETPVGSFFKESSISNRSKRKAQQISKQEMLQVLHLSQNQASKLLDCSLSTLKRRFYELKNDFGLKSWPQCFDEVRHLPIFRLIYPMSLDFIMNSLENETNK